MVHTPSHSFDVDYCDTSQFKKMANKKLSAEEYKALTLSYKWMFVDMITPDDAEKSNLGVSISRPNSSGGWCKPKPISIGEVKIANDETHFILDVSFICI